MSNSATAALREIAEKYQKGTGYISFGPNGEASYSTNVDEIFSDLTALTSELFVPKDIHDRLVERADQLTTELEELKLNAGYPKEFVEWITDPLFIHTVWKGDNRPKKINEMYEYWRESVR